MGKVPKNNPKGGNSLDFKLVGSRVLRANIYRMALIIVSLNVVVPDILYGAHTENIQCNDIKSGRLVTAPDKKILKMIKQPSQKFQRVSHPLLFFDFYSVFMEWFFNTTNMTSLGVKPLTAHDFCPQPRTVHWVTSRGLLLPFLSR